MEIMTGDNDPNYPKVLEPITFEPFPKLARLKKAAYATEKIDGSNVAVIITDDGRIGAQSRNKLITPGKTSDNFGFAGWVQDNKEELLKLGPGRHFGEWWGAGIQRGYGLKGQDSKRFSLFNVGRWADHTTLPSCCRSVPVLGVHDFSTQWVDNVMTDLSLRGSSAEPGFMKPEGIVVYLTAARTYFKVTFDTPEGKWAA